MAVRPVSLEAGHQLREALAGDAQLAGGAEDAVVAAEGVADHRAFEIQCACAAARSTRILTPYCQRLPHERAAPAGVTR